MRFLTRLDGASGQLDLVPFAEELDAMLYVERLSGSRDWRKLVAAHVSRGNPKARHAVENAGRVQLLENGRVLVELPLRFR